MKAPTWWSHVRPVPAKFDTSNYEVREGGEGFSIFCSYSFSQMKITAILKSICQEAVLKIDLKSETVSFPCGQIKTLDSPKLLLKTVPEKEVHQTNFGDPRMDGVVMDSWIPHALRIVFFGGTRPIANKLKHRFISFMKIQLFVSLQISISAVANTKKLLFLHWPVAKLIKTKKNISHLFCKVFHKS